MVEMPFIIVGKHPLGFLERSSLEEKGSGQDPLARCYWMTVLLAGIVWGFCFMYTLNDSMAQILLWE